MKGELAKWISDADALHYAERFGTTYTPRELNYLRFRGDDFYISLVGELFDRLREPYDDSVDWLRLGDAIAQVGAANVTETPDSDRGLPSDAALFAASAFYVGGYPASAYLTLRAADPKSFDDIQLACHEFLTRPSSIRSARIREIVRAIRDGNLEVLRAQSHQAVEMEAIALSLGPDQWIGWRLFREILTRLERTNVRAVLPDGESHFWDPLVRSLLNRTPPAWDFFQSQIDAVRSGLLERETTFSIQMPTGAGKTALAETLLFYHLTKNPLDAAILLVPYRSLAAELRGSLVKRLGGMGLAARCAYGGTVPTGDEIRDLANTRAIVATPEALSGLLSANPEFFGRVSLVVCDEGHLLDARNRGVGLELLLARMRVQASGSPKFVFVSAIVPNIEEINAWLGGTDDTVVRSEYRPTLAEFAVLREPVANTSATVNLHLHPHDAEAAFSIVGFLGRNDFRYRNPATGRFNTYPFRSVKTRAIATARKALSIGAVAVFAANKHGNQGVVGLAEELLSQIGKGIPLPTPIGFVDRPEKLQAAIEYFVLEYGTAWIGTRTLAAGAILHHGDIPQEAREVVEKLIRQKDVRLAICTTTLAEGVNFPIRTLVLYSVQRRQANGATENLLARDIKNLVGRAGRAGATTKGLVICANFNQWELVAPVAMQQPGEQVNGALRNLMNQLWFTLVQRSITLTNEFLEGHPDFHALIDGIDTTLIDLTSEEIGEDELVHIASELCDQTFAARHAKIETTDVMRQVFRLRARRLAGIKSLGRLGWIRETGVRVRMLESVETGLLPLREHWDNIEGPTDPVLADVLLAWTWERPEMKQAIKDVYRDRIPLRSDFAQILAGWLGGLPLVEIAQRAGLDIDTMLSVHSRVISYVLQVAVEQGVVLVKKLLEANEQQLSQAVIDFPEHLRFGVPTSAARVLAAGGVRHRRAAVALGQSPELVTNSSMDWEGVAAIARQLVQDRERWLPKMGQLVLENTIEDLHKRSSLEGVE